MVHRGQVIVNPSLTYRIISHITSYFPYTHS
jgi:hypothetical protein